MRPALFGILLLLIAGLARAEPCEMVGGCVGNIWYLHVPKTQLHSQTVFFEVAVKKGEPLAGWGSILRNGSRVRIMSYATFPQLKTVGDELFALVLVLSE
jgi:hypothetical protein